MENLHFVVTGEFLTNFSRERYKETAKLDIGIDFLCNSIIGFPRELAEKIVLGRNKLIGENNELSLEEDDCVVEPYCWLKPSNPADVVCGWISPEGKIFGHKQYNYINDHTSIAQSLVDRNMVESVSLSAESDVENAGYIKFSPNGVCAFVPKGRITEKQKEAFVEWLELKGYKTFYITPYDEEYVSKIKQMDLLSFANKICLE